MTHGAFDDPAVSRAWSFLFLATLTTMLIALAIHSRGTLDGVLAPRWTSARVVVLVSSVVGILALLASWAPDISRS